jgi:hypothetical protein
VRALGDAAERLARETQGDVDFEPQPFHASTARSEPPVSRAPVAAQPSGFAQPHPARAPTRPYPG